MKKFYLVIFLLVFGGLLPNEIDAQIAVLPHVEDFETEFQCNVACLPSCNLQGTWQNDKVNDHWDWTSDKSGTSSGGTGPPYDHTYQTSSGHYLYCETSCNTTQNYQGGYPQTHFYLVSSYYMLGNYSGTILWEYWYHMYGTGIGNLHIDVDTTQGQGLWIEDFASSHTGNQNLWKKRTIDISQFAGMDSVRFRFRYISGNNAAGDIALDDISIYQPQPVDLALWKITEPISGCGMDSAETIAVQLQNYSDSDLQIGDTVRCCFQINGGQVHCETFTMTSVVPECGDTILTFTIPADMSAPGTHHVEAWTAQAGDTTTWNDQTWRDFENIPIVSGYPYCDDWENGANLWTNGGIVNSWQLGAPTGNVINSPGSGWNSWVTNLKGKHNNGEDSYIQSACYDFTGLCRPEVQFKIWHDAEYGFDGVILERSFNGGQSWYRVGSVNAPVNWYNHTSVNGTPGTNWHGWTGSVNDTASTGGWITASHNLNNYSGLVLFRLAFGSDVSVNYEGVGIDDFVIYNGVYLGKDAGLCPGDTVTLTAQNASGDTYLWSTGATTQSIDVTTPGTYWVQRNHNSFCNTTDTIEVINIGPGFPPQLGPDVTACGSYTIDPGSAPASTFLWNNGDTTKTTTVTTSGNYYATVTTGCGVVQTDTIAVTIDSLPPLNLGPDTAHCGPMTLDAGNGSTYSWSTGATTQTITADSSATYSVNVVGGNGCTKSDTVTVSVVAVPTVDIGPDTNICNGTQVCFDAGSNPNNTYLWNNGVTTSSQCVNTPGQYHITVTNSIGCSVSDTVLVTQPAPPASGIGIDTSDCPKVQFTDIGTGGNPTSWFWDFGNGATSTQQNPLYDYSSSGTGNYLVKQVVMNNCGSDSSTGLVTIQCEIAIDPGAEEFISIYPNPNNGVFKIDATNIPSEDLQMTIIDPQGKVIQQVELNKGNSNWTHDIRLENAAKGMYLIRLLAGEKSYTKTVNVR